ncbi:MAG: hypothetical protein DMF50_10815 [Acidobacteria bacterium]|nr:MAG: hypothetical protein DMF50_10815 [Acidobacteriota bacterium]
MAPTAQVWTVGAQVMPVQSVQTGVQTWPVQKPLLGSHGFEQDEGWPLGQTTVLPPQPEAAHRSTGWLPVVGVV